MPRTTRGGKQPAIDCIRARRTLLQVKARSVQSPIKSQASDAPSQANLISEDGIDIGLLEESLSKTVWERVLANDDALRLADLLRAAMLKGRAKS